MNKNIFFEIVKEILEEKRKDLKYYIEKNRDVLNEDIKQLKTLIIIKTFVDNYLKSNQINKDDNQLIKKIIQQNLLVQKNIFLIKLKWATNKNEYNSLIDQINSLKIHTS